MEAAWTSETLICYHSVTSQKTSTWNQLCCFHKSLYCQILI